jgi:hypothetical protein
MIRMTIEAANFQELMEQIGGITLGAVVAPAPVVEPVVITDEELDSEGVTWDAEIHAPSKSKNKDGTWRAKRASKADEPAPVVAHLVVDPVVVVAEPVVITQPVVIAQPVVEPVVVTPTLTFSDLMTLISRKMGEGKLTPAKLGEIQVQFGVENISMLAAQPDRIPTVYATVDVL